MKLRFHRRGFIPHPSSFIHFGRRSQVVRQRSAKPLFIGSIPIAASKTSINQIVCGQDRNPAISFESPLGHCGARQRGIRGYKYSGNLRNSGEIGGIGGTKSRNSSSTESRKPLLIGSIPITAFRLDSGREIGFETDRFRHTSHGYAVTSYSSQGRTVDRVVVNADANESDLLLNQRMGYVAVSRAREDVIIFTNSADQLRAALDRTTDKEMAVEALRQSQDRNPLSREEWERLLSPTNREVSAEQSFDQGPLGNSGEDISGDERAAGEEIELQFNS